jgi:hypothetical protein
MSARMVMAAVPATYCWQKYFLELAKTKAIEPKANKNQ